MFLIPQIKEIFHPWYLIHFLGDFKIPNAIMSRISGEMCRLFIHAYTNGKHMVLMVARFVHKLIMIIIKKISITIIRRIKLCNDLVFQSLEAGSWKAGEGGYRPRQSSPCFTCPSTRPIRSCVNISLFRSCANITSLSNWVMCQYRLI